MYGGIYELTCERVLIVVEESIEHVVSTVLGRQKSQHLLAEGANL